MKRPESQLELQPESLQVKLRTPCRGGFRASQRKPCRHSQLRQLLA